MVVNSLVLFASGEGGRFGLVGEGFVAANRVGKSVPVDINRPAGDVAREVCAIVAAHCVCDVVALVGPGTEGSVLGMGVAEALHLADAIRTRSWGYLQGGNDGPAVVFYTEGGEGRGEAGVVGGFASRLRDALVEGGMTSVRVDAPDRAGRVGANPYVRRFEGGTGRGKGGRYLIPPTSARWEAWSRGVRDTGLRYAYPCLSRENLHLLLDCLRE